MSAICTGPAVAEDAAIFDGAVVDIASAQTDVQRTGERRLDNAGIRTRMLTGVAAYHADRFPSCSTDHRCPGCRCQCGHACRHPVGKIIEPGCGPSEPADSAACGDRSWRPRCWQRDIREARADRRSAPQQWRDDRVRRVLGKATPRSLAPPLPAIAQLYRGRRGFGLGSRADASCPVASCRATVAASRLSERPPRTAQVAAAVVMHGRRRAIGDQPLEPAPSTVAAPTRACRCAAGRAVCRSA